jgi:hypothetical protein
VPLEVDVEDHIEERSDCEPGMYRIEKKRSGEFSGEVLFYTKQDDGISSVAEPDDDVSSDENSPAEFAPRVGESLSASDIARLVSSTVNATLDARDKRPRQADSEPTVLETLRQLEEMAERRAEKDLQRRQEMRSEIASLMPKEDPLSPEQQLRLAVVEKSGVLPMLFREMREALGTAQRVAEPEGWGVKLFDFVKEVVPYVGPTIGPVIGAKLVTLLNRVDETALMNAAVKAQQQRGAIDQPVQDATVQSPQVGPDSEGATLTLDDVILFIKQEIIANSKPKESVDSVVQLIAEHPNLFPAIEDLLRRDNEELLVILSGATSTNLSIITNASKFVEGLRTGVRSRLQVPPENVTGNGHKATTTVQATAAGSGA